MRNRIFIHAAALMFGTFGASSRSQAQTPVSVLQPPPAEAKRAVDAYGDELPAGARIRLGTLRWRHSGMVVFAAYLNDGKGLLTASQDGTIRVWDVQNGKELRHFSATPAGPQPAVPGVGLGKRGVYLANQLSSACITPDGKTLVTATQNVFITLWDVATGTQQKQFRATANNGIFSLTFTPDGKSIAYASYDQYIRLINAADGREIRKYAGPMVNRNGFNRQLFFTGMQSCSLAFSADGKLLLGAGMEYGQNMFNSIVRRWEVETGKELQTIKGPQQMNFQGVAFSPDGVTAAWACNDNTARITDLITGKELKSLTGPQPSYTNAVAFTPDAKTLITRHGDQTLRLWDVASGKELRSMTSGYAVSNIAFSPDGKFLATGTNGNTVRQWEVATAKETGATTGHHGAVVTLAASTDGKAIATRSGDNMVHIWEAATGKETSRLELPPTAGQVAFSPDLRVAAVGSYDGTLRLFDVPTGKETQQWKAHQNGFMSLAISPNGKVIASRAYDQVIHLWDPATGREIRQIMPPGTVNAGPNGRVYIAPMSPLLAFSPDSSTLVGLIGNNGFYGRRNAIMPAGVVGPTLILWDVNTGKVHRRFDASKIGISNAVFSPDGRAVASANMDGSVSLWESASGKERFNFKTTSTGPVSGLVFSPNGKMLVAGGGQNSVVLFWDTMTGKELAVFRGHQGSITSLALADNGKTLISGSSDTTALIWDAAPVEKALQPLPSADLDAARADALWNELANGDAKKAFEAVRQLAGAPRQAVPLLSRQVHPVAPPDPQQLARLIADLNSNRFAVRQKASDDLERMGDLAADALQKVITGQPSLEMRTRAERLLERLVTGQSLPVQELQTLRALEVLELQATPEARDLLTQLAKGASGSRLTQQAQLTLARLGK